MTDTLTQADVELHTSVPAPEVKHYARKADIERSILYGDTIQALCGQPFRVSKDHARLPMCPPCDRVYRDPEAMGSASMTAWAKRGEG